MFRTRYSLMAALSLTAMLAACADEPTVATANRNSTPAGPSRGISIYGVSADPASLSFGQVIYHMSKTDTVTLTNAGTTTANLSTIEFVGATPIDFNIFSVNGDTPDCGSWLAAGAQCVIGVQFTPQGVGPRSADLNITVNASVLRVDLSGEGTRAALDYSPLSISYGDEAVGTTGYPRLLTIKNTGTADLQVWTIKLQGTNPGDFVVSQPSTNACVLYAPIAPNASCDIAVAFAPVAAGTRQAYLVVETVGNGALIGTANVLLVGNGTGGTSNPDADVAVSFGGLPNQVQVGKTFTYNIMVKNAGPGAASGVALNTAVPVGTGFAGLTAPSGVSCSSPLKGDTGGVSCSINSMASGSAFTVKLAVTALSGNKTVVSNSATVTSTSVDPVNGNNTATATTTIVGRK
jgi:uncharacterized repeat protein (TIGR01451 family)